MPDFLKQLFDSTRDYFTGLSSRKKLTMAITAGVIAIAATFGTVVVRQDPYQVLYSDLQLEDSKAVAKKLSEMNIPYQISDDQKTVSVPGSAVAQARMQLAKDGIPGQDVVGFEKFDATTLGMSSYVQRIQYVRAIQGELTRSIQHLSAVKRARVHISIPPKKVFLEEDEPPKASVVLELKPGQSLSRAEVQGIAHLVSSAVEGLKVNQVTIVDTHGTFLHKPEEDTASGMPSALIEMERTIETDYEKRIMELLTPVVGLGKVRAKVTAEIDSSRVNTTEETFDPEKAVARNVIKNDEVQQGSKPNPVGIPGSRSNLPGSEVQNPAIPMASTSSEKNVQNMSYAIPRKVQTTDKPSGNIKRLTVAVVVDGTYTKAINATDPDVFVPRSEEELKRLQDIVGNAVGYDAQRRDSITISSLPFKTSDFPQEEPAPGVFTPKEMLKFSVRHGWIVLAIVLFFFLILRPFLKWASQMDLKREIALLPKTVAELEAARRDEGVLALTRAANLLEEGEPLEKKEEEDLKTKIAERLDQSPKKGYRIIQDWIDGDPSNSTLMPSMSTTPA